MSTQEMQVEQYNNQAPQQGQALPGPPDNTPMTKLDFNNWGNQLIQTMGGRMSKMEADQEQTNKRVDALDNHAKYTNSQLVEIKKVLKDQTAIRIASCNILFFEKDGSAVQQFRLGPGAQLTDQMKDQAIQALVEYIEGVTGYTPIHQKSEVRVTRQGGAYYKVAFESENVANLIRSNYEEFHKVGLTCTEDLTANERAQRNAIKKIMLPYWGRQSIPNSRFSRSNLKCRVNGQFCFLSLEEIEPLVQQKRIDAYQEKNGK